MSEKVRIYSQQANISYIAGNLYTLYKLFKRIMKNIPSNQIHQIIQKQVKELINLLNYDFDTPYQLSFNPFTHTSAPTNPRCLQNINNAIQNLSVAYTQLQVGIEAENLERMEEFAATLLISEFAQQKNQESQLSVNKIKKTKQIKKAQKIKKTNQIVSQIRMEHQEELPVYEIAQATTAPDNAIRDNNNPKVYHKLLKNLLEQKKLGHLIKNYEKMFPNRYYFLIALTFIKFYVNEDFTEEYAKIVEKEVKAKEKKIAKKLEEKGRIEKRIKQMQATKGNASELEGEKLNLEKQIIHTQMVIYEMKEFSMRSCAAFFQGDIEESLKILYLKDDPVMRKRQCFESALVLVKEIHAQVREASSRNS